MDIVQVTKSFKDTHAVANINLRIGAGEFFSLLGPSGCGKTTLLRMIAGFEQPSLGKILVDGRDMSDVPPHRRPVNMVFQSYALFPHLSVYENVAFGLKVSKSCPQGEIPDRVKEALELVRLPHLAHRFPKELSGGQQQRVAFARAIVNRPKVLLLDEPLSALDPRIREEMQAELSRFKSELGITFVMVTHDQAEAFALSDRIAVFNHGHLEQVGSPEEIYQKPKTAFVADFIGQTNLLSGVVAEIQPPFVLLKVNAELLLWVDPGESLSFLQAGSQATAFIRNEAFLLAGHTPSLLDRLVNQLTARVMHRSYQGNVSEYRLSLPGDVTVCASARNEKGVDYHAGMEINVALPAAAAHLLPPTEVSVPEPSPALT